jgi:hypothetical protein
MKSRTWIPYALLFLIETIGMILILWDGIPLFRHLIRFQHASTPVDTRVMLFAVLLIQTTYWGYLRHDPPFDLPRQQLLGHIFLFVNRLVFIFASGVFSLVVYRYSDMFDLSLTQGTLMMAVLFSVFCFSRHLERIGIMCNQGHRAASPAPPGA